jgi:hypothetical protein
MADIEEQELNCSGSNNETVNETSQAYAVSQPPDNFDKGMLLEEVRKYRCLWDVNSESYKIWPVNKMHGFKFKRDGKHCTENSILFFKVGRE